MNETLLHAWNEPTLQARQAAVQKWKGSVHVAALQKQSPASKAAMATLVTHCLANLLCALMLSLMPSGADRLTN
jgi:hypothetical protein